MFKSFVCWSVARCYCGMGKRKLDRRSLTPRRRRRRRTENYSSEDDSSGPFMFHLRAVLSSELGILAVLAFWGAPAISIQLCAAVQKHMIWDRRRIIAAYESSAGHRAITRHFARLGYPCAAFEIQFDPVLDFASPAGFATSIALALCLKLGVFFSAGPTCSSMVFLCMKQTLRFWAAPEGNPFCPSVANGNIIHAKMVLLLYSAQALVFIT